MMSDSFLELTHSAGFLYSILSVNADDDGFIGNPKTIVKIANCKTKDLEELVDAGYVIMFESGVIALTHWKVGNSIQKDRYTRTEYQKEFEQLVENGNKVYTLCIQDGNTAESDSEQNVSNTATCIQNVSNLETQYRLGEDRFSSNTSINKLGEVQEGGGAECFPQEFSGNVENSAEISNMQAEALSKLDDYKITLTYT